MNFISRKSLNDETFSRFRRFLAHYKTRDMKIQNFPLQNRQNNRLSHMTCDIACHYYNSLAKTLHVWNVKMNFVSNKSLNDGTLSHFKRSLMPCRTRDMNSKLPIEKLEIRISFLSQTLRHKIVTTTNVASHVVLKTT